MSHTVEFLQQAALYFEARPTHGEDRAHWANVYNAKNCREAATTIASLTSALENLVKAVSDTRMLQAKEQWYAPELAAARLALSAARTEGEPQG